jgi:hypothetical protein
MALERASLRRVRDGLFGQDRAIVLLRAAWPTAVGADLARRTEVVGLEAGTLRIRVPDASWRKALHRMRGQILSRLRDVAGPLAPARLGFMEASLAPATGRPAPPPPPPPPKPGPIDSPAPSPVPDGVAQAAHAIPDPEMRARVLQSAARYLARYRPPDRTP